MTRAARVAVAAVGLAAVLLTTGTLHFASPRGFESIVPRFLGSAAWWVRISGVGELACAVALLIPRTRRAAGWACAALFVIVFPANIDMAVHAWQGDGSKIIAYGRLPLQLPLVLWAVYIARGAPDHLGKGASPCTASELTRSSTSRTRTTPSRHRPRSQPRS